MKQYNFIRLLVNYYNYLLLLTIFSNFIWLDGSVESFLWLGILLVIPYLLYKAGRFLHFGENKKKRASDEDNEIRQTCYPGLLVFTGILALPETLTVERPANTFLCCMFYVAALGIYFYWRYYSGKYFVLYRNPSVSENTRTRAESRMQSLLVKFGMIGVVGAVVIILAVAGLAPEVQMEPISTVSTPKPEEKKEKAKKLPKETRTEQPRLPEEKKSDNFLLLVIRYVAWALVVAFALIGVLFLFFKVIMFFVGMRMKGEYEYYERIEEKTDTEEYSRLIPVMRKTVSFPPGNAGKVRRAFYRAVKKGADGKRIDSSHTPYELCEKYFVGQENSEFLTRLYEKVRYSADEVSDEEVNRIEK